MESLSQPGVLLSVLLGGVGGAVVSFVLQVWREGEAARSRAVAAARVVRLEIIRNESIYEVFVKSEGPFAEHLRSGFRRDAFDRLALDLVPILSNQDLLELTQFYSLHEQAAKDLEDPRRTSAPDRALLLWQEAAEVARIGLELATGRWWTRWKWQSQRREHARRRDDLNREMEQFVSAG